MSAGAQAKLSVMRQAVVQAVCCFVLSAFLDGVRPTPFDVYVSPNGNDSNPGTINKPLKSLQRAADLARPGTTIYVRGGLYCERLKVTYGGSQDAGFVSFQSQAGERAILDGSCLKAAEDDDALVELRNVSFVRVRGFEVRNLRTDNDQSVPWGIRVVGAGSHIEILNNDVHHIEQNSSDRGHPGNGLGIGVYGTNAKAPISDLVTELPLTERVLAKFSLPSASRSLISSGFSNVQALDVSPDRASLLVAPMQGSGENEFWTLPVNAGTALKLGELTGRDASWSADGQQLIFSKGSALYVAKANGTEERKIYSADGSVFGPRLSPDGKRIRFTVGNTSQSTTVIWEVGRDGTNPHAVLNGWEYASGGCCGKWTADGRYFIFQVTQNSPTTVTALWALPDTGAVPVRLTNGPISFGNASPASDNKRIWAIGVQPAGQAVKYNAHTREFVAFLPGVSATDMDFSSDGKWVTYVAVPEGTLWRCRADGSERLQLTSPPRTNRFAALVAGWQADRVCQYAARETLENCHHFQAGRESRDGFRRES